MAVEIGFRSLVRGKKWQFVLAVLLLAKLSLAQCVTSFPYKNDFENNTTGWTTGGTSSDWTWGTPAKFVINQAASGTKCWITGGLTGSSYNNGELAWLQSPCFNFSSIPHPYITFAVFWETELSYDGAVLEYSTDNGASWQRAGSISDPVNCLNENWFNTSAVRYANNGNGWSGSILGGGGSCGTGGGSGKWLLAKHTFPALAGQSNVRFRFLFGAGTTCNAYNGFAIDDFYAAEAQPNQALFDFSCVNGNTVNMINTSIGCPNYSWNFGDPASGSNNSSTLLNPSHTYNTPGTYTISLTASGPDNAPSMLTKTVTILDLNTQILSQPLCYGDKTGSATVTATPNVAGLSFDWSTSPGQSGATVNNLGAGTYIVTVSGSGVCNTQDNITIVEPSKISNALTILQPVCQYYGGEITLSTSGGVAPYSYTWSPNMSFGNSAIGLSPGNYSATVTDKNNCSVTEHVTLTGGSTIVTSVLLKKDVSCLGKNDGSILIGLNGGTGPYNLSWSPTGGNQQQANNLGPGTYTLTIKDQNGCSTTASATINEPSQLVTSVSKKDAVCNGNNGAATITATGGTAPYSYLWSPGGNTSNSASNLAAGNYNVTTTDNNGCTYDDVITISNTTGGINLQMQQTDLLCYAGNNGSASVTAGGGTAPYTYQWSNGSTSNTIAGLVAGNYSVVVTDATGCAATTSATITEPAGFTINIQSTDAVCNKGNGSLQANVTGGLAPYSYAWNPGGASNQMITTTAGTYTVTVTDKNGCLTNANATISEPVALTVDLQTVQPGCSISTGTITANVTGGTIPYSYSWIPGSAATQTISNLAPGSYTVAITDKNGCKTQKAATINAFNSMIVQTSKTDVLCNGQNNGTAAVAISGGQSPYSIAWSNGATTNSIGNLGAGSYTATVTDATNCMVTKSFDITQPSRINIQLTATPATCTSDDGSIISNVTGGNGSYKYEWLPGNSTNANLQQVPAATYSLTVTDSNGCTATASSQVTSIDTLQIDLGADTILCMSSNETIVLSPGAFSSYVWQDGSRNANYTASTEGLYYVTVTDQQGCSAFDSIQIKNDCGDIYFPSAFTPNNDGKNDLFGPLGNLSALKNFELVVCNRWGQRVFVSNNPFMKWDGHMAGAGMITGTYVWYAHYIDRNGDNKFQKGTVILIR